MPRQACRYLGGGALTSSDIIISESQAIEWSLHCSVVTVFSKTRAAGYLSAIGTARRADRYAEGILDGKLIHVAGFGRGQAQIALALRVITHLRTSSTLQIYGGGKVIQDNWRIADVLECVVTASSCGDTRAHCTVVVDEDRLGLGPPPPMDVAINIQIGDEPALPDRFGLWRIGTRSFPCRYLFEHGFKFQHGHPSSEDAQIQAAAVRSGCDWCPHLAIGRKRLPATQSQLSMLD